MYSDRFPFTTTVEISRRPRRPRQQQQQDQRRRRKETVLTLGGFLLALGGSLWLLENDQVRVAVLGLLSNHSVVDAGAATNVRDEPVANSPASPAQPAKQNGDPSRRRPSAERPAALRRPSSEGSKSPGVDRKTLWSKRTLAFWNSLNRIMTKEVAMRKGNHRNRRSTEFAVRAIRGLDRRYVDVRVQALAEEIVEGYSEQLQIGTDRIVVLTAATQSGAPRRQVRRDVELDRRSEILRGKMADKYNHPFPSLQ